MDYDEINLLGYKFMKIKITQVKRCSTREFMPKT